MIEFLRHMIRALFFLPELATEPDLPDEVERAAKKLETRSRRLKETTDDIVRHHDPLDVLVRAMREGDGE